MNTEYRRAIADAVARITATNIVEGESSDKLRQAIADRVADLGNPSNGAASTFAPHQQRVVDEKDELDKKATALSQFIGNSAIFPTLDAAEQERLREQNDVMWIYSEILGKRIAAFTAD